MLWNMTYKQKREVGLGRGRLDCYASAPEAGLNPEEALGLR
jgi:hypothetical protein